MNAKPDVNYRDAALIVWDMQNGIAGRAFNSTEIVRNTRLLIDSAHEHDLPVIYSQHTGLPYEYLSKYGVYSLKKRGVDPKSATTFMAEGSDEWKIIEELAPSDEDLVFKKFTASFFTGTIVEQILRNRNVDTIILTGVSTEGGVDGTARHGSSLGFIPVIARDAVGSFDPQVHEKMLEIMGQRFEVETTAAIIKSTGT